MSDDEVEVNSPESWSIARRYAALVGPIPTAVSAANKILWADHNQGFKCGVADISRKGVSAVKRLDKNVVLKTPIYFAAQSLFPDRFAETTEDDTNKALLRILEPGIFAAILGLIYVHRRFKKVCKSEQWEQLASELIIGMEQGFILGTQLKAFDPATCILAGGIRSAALATYLMREEKSYLAYRNLNKLYDVEFEISRWGCDHGQIAGFLLKALGYFPDQMFASFAVRGHAQAELQDPYIKLRQSLQFLDATRNSVSLQDMNFLSTDIAVSETEHESMMSAFQELDKSGSTFTWMARKSKDA